MNTTPENFIQRLSALTLSDEKRTSLRAELSAYTDLHAVKTPTAPYGVRKSGTVLDWFTDRRSLYAGAVAVLVLATGSTATFAAEGSLPGDALYPVKIHVNEPLAEALATTPQAKAEVSTQLAERRIDEATMLAAKGKLDTNTATYLETAVIKQVDSSNSAADELAASGNIDAATDVRASLEDRLSARADALATAASTTDQTEQVFRVLAVVAERTHSIALARADEDATATSTLAIDAVTATNFAVLRANAKVSAFSRSSAMLVLPEAVKAKSASVVREDPMMTYFRSTGSTTATSTATSTDADATNNRNESISSETDSHDIGNGLRESPLFLPASMAPATAGR